MSIIYNTIEKCEVEEEHNEGKDIEKCVVKENLYKKKERMVKKKNNFNLKRFNIKFKIF